MIKTNLCIGGELAGLRRDEPSNRIVVALSEPMPSCVWEEGQTAVAIDYKTQTYTRKIIRFGEWSAEVWALEGMPIGKVIEELLNGYNPKSKDV